METRLQPLQRDQQRSVESFKTKEKYESPKKSEANMNITLQNRDFISQYTEHFVFGTL